MDYKAIKGFNYQPSYGRTAVEIWIDRFDSEVIQRELGLGRRYFPGINTVRLWLSPDAFFKDPTLFSQNFESVLTICDEFDLRTIPILFNNWHSIPDFGGICTEMINYWFGSYGKRGQDANYVFRPYLKAMFSDHGRDERILAWDMCNEPFNSGMSAIFVEWLNHTYAEGKQLGAGQPIGTSVGPELKHLRLIEPCSDILMIHPYFAASISWDKIKAFAIAKG
jgi:hypothetical protein